MIVFLAGCICIIEAFVTLPNDAGQLVQLAEIPCIYILYSYKLLCTVHQFGAWFGPNTVMYI